MASYAALLSLMNTLNQINKHPSPPISLDQSQVESLTQNLSFFQDFFECHSSTGEEETNVLESRIAGAAYAAEDVIETHIVDQIHHARSTSESISSVDLYGDLKRVIQEMDLIKSEVMEIIQDKIMRPQNLPHLQHSNSSRGAASTWQSNSTPVFDDALVNQVLDKLIGQLSSLQIIPIVGMGGIGKTTFARSIYSNSLIVHHFDILVWVTISQDYSMSGILGQILCQGNKESEISENELGERVHKMLWGRRYLIVMDDMWNDEALNKVRCFFQDSNNGSRVMITTRLSNLAFELSGSHVSMMKFLDEDKSWGLLCEIVFDKELDCPMELKKIGREIARKCKGHPLSIVVIGGLLKKSNWTREYWEYTLQNLNLLINLEDGEYCLKILSTSYMELPIHLKPCFLYMGIFREDERISATELVELWVAEGILRPTKGKRLEEVGENNIKELIDRNLILIDMLRWNGTVKVCKIHDLLRDLCLREAQKQRFLCVLKHQRDLNIPQCMNMERRICIHDNTGDKYSSALESASVTRSLFSTTDWPEVVESLSSRLLRVYSGDYNIHDGLDSVEAIFKKSNLRFLHIVIWLPELTRFPFSWFPLWNLQTLMIDITASHEFIMAPFAIWEMPLLRQVVIEDLELQDPPCGKSDLILEELHTISRVKNFKCTDTVIKKIPNVKTLKLSYEMSGGEAEYHNFGLNNIGHLSKLQSLDLHFTGTANLEGEIFQCYLMQNLSFPHSLKELTLEGTNLKWEECMIKIGWLPLLEYLKLGSRACCGAEWKTIEGQFCSLKFLHIGSSYDLRYWRTEDTHFPRLEHLVLLFDQALEEIPSSIGDIPTLKSIRLNFCSRSAEISARRIKKEQLKLGNIDLQLHIINGDQIRTAVSTVRFFMKIEKTLKHQREKNRGFFNVMKDYEAQRIEADGLQRAAKELFKGHPDLILGFYKLFPEVSEFTDSDEEEAP